MIVRELLEKRIERQYVILELCWVVKHRFFFFSFLICTLLYYRCLICLILNKKSNSILMRKQ